MAAELVRKRYGHLDCLEVRNSQDGPWVVLLHGYGADASDLAPLAHHVQVHRDVNWLFPNGHQKVQLGPHVEGRAWFPISISELEKAATSGEPIDLSKHVPPGMGKARENVLTCLEKLGAPLNRVCLGGFSQGAMVATDVAMHLPQTVAGLVILSGACIAAEQWKQLAPGKAPLPYFQSHGRQDPVLSLHGAQVLNTLLKQSGWSGQLLEFNGGHEIPAQVLIQMAAYLRSRLR